MTEMTGKVATAGRGRLAEVIASRGGTAAPEAPFVIEHREALIYLLCGAAELEHGIMCQYLFAVFSLEQRADEGRTAHALAGQPLRRLGRRQPLRHPRTRQGEPSERERRERLEGAHGRRVRYEQDIRPLFRDRDIHSMSFAFDLSSYDDVRANAEAIHQKLAAGSMPAMAAGRLRMSSASAPG